MTNHTTHATISVTVDVVLFCMYNASLHILLIERKYPPFAGAWALPGGFVEADETLAQAARRDPQGRGRRRVPPGPRQTQGWQAPPIAPTSAVLCRPPRVRGV